MLDLIRTHYAYNEWANDRLLTSLQQLSPEEYATVEASGHGSIRDTFAHLITTEQGWFSWFDGSKPMSESYALKIDGEELPSPAAARRRWEPVREQLARTVAAQTDKSLAETWEFTLPSGFAAAIPLWKMMLHVANHSTHTRAQIVAAIRRAGHTPENVDEIRFIFMEK